MNKLYLNITNHCQYSCPFCCMYSNPSNDVFMDFHVFQKIIDTNNLADTIIQLEGGEPLTNPLIYLFLEYCMSRQHIQGVVIDTNGEKLLSVLDKLIEIAERYKKELTIKPSINTYLLSQRENMIEIYDNLASSCEFLDNINFNFNIRFLSQEDKTCLLDKLTKFLSKSYIKYTLFQFNRYGKAANNSDLPDIKISQIYNDWKIYSCDGTCFNQDLVKRSMYEQTLSK